MRPTLASTFFFLLACTQSNVLLEGDAGDDARSETDAGRPDTATRDAGTDSARDAGTDAGVAPDFGTPCETATDCEPLCAGDSDCTPICSLLGRCTTSCDVRVGCGTDELLCASLEGSIECVLVCSLEDEDPCEARGLGCFLTSEDVGLCIPGCTEDRDCDDGRVCQRTRGGGRCFRPGVRIGDLCEVRTDGQVDCGDQQECVGAVEGATMGVCVGRSCSVDADPCDSIVQSGTVCAPLSIGDSIFPACVPRCTEDDDCSAEYVCRDLGDGRGRGCTTP
ncbi:MAG: hypothetical protein AAGE52_19655 [Myxococcota bacterium]